MVPRSSGRSGGAHVSSRSEGSESASLGRTASAQSSTLPALPWSDWEIDPRDIQICRADDGSDFKLGAGAYGTVRRPFLWIPISNPVIQLYTSDLGSLSHLPTGWPAALIACLSSLCSSSDHVSSQVVLSLGRTKRSQRSSTFTPLTVTFHFHSHPGF